MLASGVAYEAGSTQTRVKRFRPWSERAGPSGERPASETAKGAKREAVGPGTSRAEAYPAGERPCVAHWTDAAVSRSSSGDFVVRDGRSGVAPLRWCLASSLLRWAARKTSEQLIGRKPRAHLGQQGAPSRGSEVDELLRSYSVVAPKCMEGGQIERLRSRRWLGNGRPQGRSFFKSKDNGEGDGPNQYGPTFSQSLRSTG